MRPPDLQGPSGKGWSVPMPTHHDRPETAATLATWVLTIPEAHPAWHSYVLSLIHLRDIPGGRPAQKEFPEATHEVLLFALDPGEPLPDIDAGDRFRPAMLSPVNLIEQFTAESDAQAVSIAEGLARAFVLGHASPDTDYRAHTVALLHRSVEQARGRAGDA